MGILDDAIREHLELKRKHGVAEEELQRQEEEALGPARREVAQQHENGEPAAGDDGTAPVGDAAAPDAGEETVLFDMEDAVAAGSAVSSDEPELDRDAPDEELEPAEEALEPEDDELLSAEEEAAAEEGDPDVLEDTPDFLQETPEHDRLWFEQKPPRDFDFD